MPTPENANFETFTILAFNLLSHYSSQYELKKWIEYLNGFGRYDCLNFDDSKYGNLSENC